MAKDKTPDANRDPITGEAGAHPVGTGVGAAAGGMAAGAAAGTVAAGPVGTLVGAAVGAVAGGLAGKAVAEHFDPTVEDTYWRDNFQSQGYYQKGMTYEDYEPAYRLGYESRSRYASANFDEINDVGTRQARRARSVGSRDEQRSSSLTGRCNALQQKTPLRRGFCWGREVIGR
jgi:hypothetical protein